jgi:hypothetical protein
LARRWNAGPRRPYGTWSAFASRCPHEPCWASRGALFGDRCHGITPPPNGGPRPASVTSRTAAIVPATPSRPCRPRRTGTGMASPWTPNLLAAQPHWRTSYESVGHSTRPHGFVGDHDDLVTPFRPRMIHWCRWHINRENERFPLFGISEPYVYVSSTICVSRARIVRFSMD